MKMLDKWLRPRWQHPDTAVRLKALAEDTIDSSDCQVLASTDPDPVVRELAIKRLESIEQLMEVLRAQPAAQPAIATRLADLLLNATATSIGPQLDAVVAAVAATPGVDRLAREASDSAIRVAAVAVASDPTTLSRCALHDRAAEVRVQAVQGIDDETALHEIARAARGRDKTVARVANQRLSDLRMRRERAAERAGLLDRLAALADSAELDPDALRRARSNWQDLHGDADAAQLARYAALAPRLDARLAAWRDAEQADRTHRAEREQLLKALRALAAGLSEHAAHETRAGLEALRSDWAQATALQDRWRQRLLDEEWQEAVADAEAHLREREKLAAEEQAIASAAAEIEAQLERGKLIASQVEAARQRCTELARAHGENAALERPLRQLHQLVDRMSAEFNRQCDRLKTVRGQLRDTLDALDKSLQQQQLEAASAAHRKASKLLAEAGGSPEFKSLQRRLAKSEPQLRELQSWRNWGSDKAREELVDDARALVEADIDVAERMQRLKSLRARWKSLGGGGAKARRLWEAFDTACTAAYEPIKKDRKDQARQREQHLAERAEICVRLERLVGETDWSAPDWRATDRKLSEAKRAWRSAGATPHKKWDAIRQRFDRAVDALDQHLAKERRHNFLQRQALVKEAESLADNDKQDMRQAVAEARRLRDAWHVTVHSPRKDEQALWAAFTAALDAVHGRDRAARDAFKADLEEHRRQAEALCRELEQLVDDESGDVSRLRSGLGRLATAFRDLGPLPKRAGHGLEARFEAATEAMQRCIAAAEMQQARQALHDYRDLHGICEQTEALAQGGVADAAALEALSAAWQASARPSADAEVLQALEQRFAEAMRVLAGEAPPTDGQVLAGNAAQRCNICLDLELLRKQASPTDAQAARMQRQVVLLEAAMQGSEESPEEQVSRLQREYLCLGPVPADQQQALAERFGRLFP